MVLKSVAGLIVMLFLTPSLIAKTWYIRPDGGTRFSQNVAGGQCDGSADAPYPGHGSNQHCAFKDFRYLWDDDSGRVGSGAWVIAGGDTILVRGCSASRNQAKPANPDCRIGWDQPTGACSGGVGANCWCYGVGSYTCFNPPIPSGTAAHHTRILGANYANCNAGGGTDPRSYRSNLTQLFGGFSLQFTFNLQNARYVDIQCIELTTHNGQCTTSGDPAYPRPCSNNQPLDDYAQNGFQFNNKSSNIILQDVYVHGFNASGISGPIGGPVTLTRVFVGFNGFSGWNFDNGGNTPDAAGSSIEAHFVTMIGNGCYEEYPVKHVFSAQACYDDSSNGFGDAWSGQDTDMDSFTCDHCVMAYNTKDAFMGPHTTIKKLTIESSQSYGNMGAQWKWNNAPGARTVFINNLTVGSCTRFAETIPGAAHSFAKSSGLPGAYLTDFCRAGGNTVAINSQQNSTVQFANNTFVDYASTVFLLGCGPVKNNRNKMCGNTPFIFKNNIFLGYTLKGGEAPALLYIDDPSIKVVSDHNIDFGNRASFLAGCAHGNICSDPLLINEPPQKPWTTLQFLDNFNFIPQNNSPAVGRGVAINEVTMDYFGKMRPNPPSIGAVEPHR